MAPVDPVDPAWWRDVLAAYPESDIALASVRLREASVTAASTDARAVLNLLALVTSAMLDPDDWNDPFMPMATFQGRRSAVPSDLDAEQLHLLRRIAESMDSCDTPALRARVTDICWTYGNRGDAAMLVQAIDSYSSVPLEPDQWYRGGSSEWKRGLELVKRRGNSGLNQLEAMADTLRRRLEVGTSADGFFAVELSATIRNYRLTVRSDAETLAKLCVGRAGDADDAGNLMLQRGWEEEATAWYAMADRKSDAWAAQVRIAHSFAAEARARRDEGGGQAMAAAHFVEQSIKVLTALPRTYRAEHGLDDLTAQLRRPLQEDRQRILDGMVSIKSDPIDISNLVETARRKVSDLEKMEALVALGNVHTWMPFDAAMQQAESSMASHALLSLLGNETFSGTGQKVASRPGSSPASIGRNASEPAIDPAVWATAVRDRTALFGLVVSARILPALEVVTTQHRYPIELLYDVCRNSPLVPHGHELIWARGLRHGLNNDFASAACILVPQIEHLVRTHLKQNGVHTLVTDDNGVETEKGLTPLLEDSKTAEVLGQDLVFELQALLTQQEVGNLRNTMAHGLAADHDLFSEHSVYAWWLALRLATLPFAEQNQNQMA